MKIYTKIILQWQPNGELALEQHDFFDYEGNLALCGDGKGGSPPPPPDYTGAAKAQGQANLEAAVASSKLSNPNIITPYGSQTVIYGDPNSRTFNQSGFDAAMKTYQDQLKNQNTQTWVPGTNTGEGGETEGHWIGGGDPYTQTLSAPKQGLLNNISLGMGNPVAPNQKDYWSGGGDPYIPTVTQTLSAPQQKLLDQYNNINLALGDVSQQGLSYVQDQLNHPFDQSALPASPVNAGQTYADAAWGRLQPHIDQSNQQLQSQLANQGIMQGSEAYNNSMRNQSQAINDLQQQVAAGSLDADQRARQSAIQEQSFFRNEPLNTLNAVRSSAQIQNPQFQGFQGSQVAPAPVFQAAQAQGQADIGLYNANTANANSQQQGLMNLGMTGAMFF